MAARFDHYVIVDWSAANQPKRGHDSIWVCHRGPAGERCENPPTRMAAKALIADILAGAKPIERVLVGFDFPFGYPAGFAARLGLAGPPWRAVWDEIARLIADDAQNRNNRFALAAGFNRRVSGAAAFPFWGCPTGFADPFLGPRHHRAHGPSEELRERRLIDERMTGAQPCWKLAYTGSVGSQALTGIPVVRALRDDERWVAAGRVWPFETGLGPPGDARIIFAEVWPSWWRRDIRPDYGPPRDRAQVRTVAEIFAARDSAGELAAWFAGDPDLTPEQRRIVESEEAWTLGVTGPNSERLPARPIRSGSGLRRSARNDDRISCHCEAQSDKAIAFLPPPAGTYAYLRDPAAIYRRSFALVRAEAGLERFPAALRPLAVRLAHAAGDVGILDGLAWSRGAFQAGRRALERGAAILADSTMVAGGISAALLPAANPVICTLNAPTVAALACTRRTTRSAAAIELWRPHLDGAVVAIGNAPTALFRLLELLAEGAPRPAVVLGFPVGFVGAAEAKEALIGFGAGLPYIALRGRRGGSALAAAAVNALCHGSGRGGDGR
jgi:precorrin-8X/cobalt-precorrin-8 methylmutase